jgi:hypothetical protein
MRDPPATAGSTRLGQTPTGHPMLPRMRPNQAPRRSLPGQSKWEGDGKRNRRIARQRQASPEFRPEDGGAAARHGIGPTPAPTWSVKSQGPLRSRKSIRRPLVTAAGSRHSKASPSPRHLSPIRRAQICWAGDSHRYRRTPWGARHRAPRRVRPPAPRRGTLRGATSADQTDFFRQVAR